jgi:hypothetical protein
MQILRTLADMRQKSPGFARRELKSGLGSAESELESRDCGSLAAVADAIVAPWVALLDECLDSPAPTEENRQKT